LVAQNPKDEPASVLLEKIRKEKEQLLKADKIKKDKNESVIYKDTEDNSIYQLFVFEDFYGAFLCNSIVLQMFYGFIYFFYSRFVAV
jgi:hypothetical protein